LPTFGVGLVAKAGLIMRVLTTTPDTNVATPARNAL